MDRFSDCKRNSSSNPLKGLGEQLLTLVWESASSQQLGSWLRVPLEHAAAKRCSERSVALCLKLLEAGADAFVRRDPVVDRSPLLAAAQAGNSIVVSALLDNGSAPDGEDWQTSVFSDVMFASGNIACSASLVFDDSITSTSGAGRTPLHFAASGGHVSMVTALVGAGADLDVADADGCTPLHLAVFRGFEEVVEYLVTEGASVDTSDAEGETPLHTASAHGSLGMVKAILRGSRENTLLCPTTDHLGMPPLHRAALGGHCAVMSELLRHGSSLHALAVFDRTALHAAALSGSGDAVRFLLDRDCASLELEDREGRTALHLAAGHRLGSDETLQILLESGAKIEAKTVLGETPLHKACKALRVSAVQQLLRFGANDAAVDAEGQTSAAMTARLLRSQCPGMFRDMLQNILTLLEGAPADRVWRRRGWLLILRSRQREKSGPATSVIDVITNTQRSTSSTAIGGEWYHHPRGGTRAGVISVTRSISGQLGVQSESDQHRRRPRNLGKSGDTVVLKLATCEAPSCAVSSRETKRHSWCCEWTTRAQGTGCGACRRGLRSDNGASFLARESDGAREGDRELRSVVERTVGVDEDGVFRNIIAFL